MNNRLFQFYNKLINIFPLKLRIKFLKIAGMAIGNNSAIFPNVYFDNAKNILIGKNTSINKHTKFYTGYSTAKVIIGSNVDIGCDCRFICVTHEINKGDAIKRAGINVYKDIVVEDGCWLGAGVTILPGIHIAKGCIIGANSTVTQDTQANGVYVGSPAKRIKDL